MTDIRQSTAQYEDWLRAQLAGDVVKKDLERKHEKMRESPFAFLRATYWRWAETVLEICPDLADAPAVLAVGDIHLENFGTWRDADGRLVWGVNDFDEAAEMPYVLDLIRLATSALVARKGLGVTPDAICSAILQGYREGLKAPQPVVLDRDRQWLRELVVVSEKKRAKFWKKIEKVKAERAPAALPRGPGRRHARTAPCSQKDRTQDCRRRQSRPAALDRHCRLARGAGGARGQSRS